MIDSATFTRDMLSNPTKLMKATIDAMQAGDNGNPVTIADPNNGFVMQYSSSLAIFAKFSEKVDYVNSFFYSKRARNAEQLYPHLSEFDYINLMASPATLPFYFAMSRDWIISNSVYYDTNYNKIEIPATSSFTLGGVVYSMYYPIEILVNRNTGAVTAFYDTSASNSLNTLVSNQLLKTQEFTTNGLNYFAISFNMYQFQRTSTKFTVGAEQGFIKTLNYTDQFYAVKVFNTNTQGVETELAYSLDSKYYDYLTPTVIISLLNDTQQIKLQIPQIYFDNGQISKTVRVELYSTKGAVNYALSLADVKGITADFDTLSSLYAAPLTQMPTYTILPTTLTVAGGSNILSYAQIRDAVVNGRLYDRVAVTTPEIIEAGKKAGFDLTRVTDDLTERVYTASNILTDTNGMVIPTFAGNILIANDSLTGDPSSILNYTDGYYTILPTTTFTIANNGLTCTPLTDGQVATISALTTQEMVDELNKGVYVRQPFHITLLTTAKSPQALIYNLLAPSMTSLAFVAENAHSAPQMSATSCSIFHLGNGTGGYQIVLGITRSSNIVGVNASNFNVYLTCKTKTGAFVYLPAVYQSTDANGIDSWNVALSTSYHITTDDHMTVVMYDTTNTPVSVEIPLNQTFTILTSFNASYDPSVPIDTNLNLLLPGTRQSTDVVMAQQTMEVSLGTNLSRQIYCGVNTSWGNDVYKTADTTVYYSTNVPVFQMNNAGVINTRLNSTTHNVEVVVLYEQGTTPPDTKDISLTCTADTLVPSGNTTSFTVDDPTGLLNGMAIRGLNIPVGTVVTGVTGKVVTVSKKITALVPKGTVLVVTNATGSTVTTVVQPAPGVQLTIDSTANLVPGVYVFGFDIPAGAIIASVDSATQFSLSTPTLVAVAAFTQLSFINMTANGVVKTQVGDVITDPTGAPVVIKDAQNQYLIPAILFDGRLFASQDLSDQEIVTVIAQDLQNYANQITTMDAGLIEDSSVYYKPARTMGFANFGIGGGLTINMSLELSFSMTIYVDVNVLNTQTLLTTMETAAIGVVNQAIQNPIISLSDITEQVKTALGSNVSGVEMDVISGMPGLRLVSLIDSGSSTSIENLLSIQSDGTITRKPNIAIKFLPKPDTAESSTLALL